MKAVALVLAHANQDDVNSPVSPRDSRTPLHLAASLGNLAIAQLLIWVSEKNIHKKIKDQDKTRDKEKSKMIAPNALVARLLAG